MAITLTKVGDGEDIIGRQRSVLIDVTFDDSYPTGGESIAATDIGLSSILGARHWGGNAAAGTLLCHWDTTNKKLMLFHPTGGAAAPATLTAPVAAAPAIGTFVVTTTPDAGGTTVTGSTAKPALTGVITGALAAPALTAGLAKEVGNTTNCATIVVRMQFIGL